MLFHHVPLLLLASVLLARSCNGALTSEKREMALWPPNKGDSDAQKTWHQDMRNPYQDKNPSTTAVVVLANAYWNWLVDQPGARGDSGFAVVSIQPHGSPERH